MSQSLLGQFLMSKRTARELLGVGGIKGKRNRAAVNRRVSWPPEGWRYSCRRGGIVYGTRTEPSQGSNTGSNPVTAMASRISRSEKHTAELQSRPHNPCPLLLEKKTK